MGNEQSSNKNDKQFIDNLQKQILQNQLQIQQLQLNNLSQNNNSNHINSTNTNNSSLNNILKNPNSRNKFLQKLLDEQEHKMTPEQINKIRTLVGGQPNLNNYGTQSYDMHSREILLKEQNRTMTGLSDNFNDDELRAKQEYELEQQKLKHKYTEHQKQRKLEYEDKLRNIEKNNIDALKLFQLNRTYTFNELKNSYKKLAIKTHPDRPNGSNEKFQLVTKCYFLLLEKLKNESSNKSYSDLKKESKSYRKEQKTHNIKMSKDKFNLKMFNKIFEENKIYDANSEGYEDWIKNDSKTKQPELFSDKFNIDVFNNTFNQQKSQNPRNQIIEYKEPDALVSCDKMGFSSIDNNRLSSFTKCSENNNDLGYSDLKSAYTNGDLINPNLVDYKTYKNMDELERDRGNISYQMSSEDIAKYEMKKKIEQQEEEERQYRIKQRDNVISDNYQNVHQRMIGYASSPDMSR